MKTTASPSAKKNNSAAFQNFLRNAAAITLFAAPYIASMTPTTAHADSWTYDFGSGTTASAAVTTSANLPTPTSGTAYVRVGTAGSISLNNPGDTALGTLGEINLTTATSASATAFAIADWANPTKYFDVSFQLSYTGVASGAFFYATLGDGTNYSTNLSGAFTNAQTAAGIRLSSAGALLYNGTAFTTTNVSSTGSMTANTVLNFRLIGNTSTASMNYSLGSSTYAVGAGKVDYFFYAGSASGNYSLVADDFGANSAQSTSSIDSIGFYALGVSAGASNSLKVDNIAYYHRLPIERKAEA